MNILFVSTSEWVWGGSEELFAASALALRAKGHAVHLVRSTLDRTHPRIAALADAGCRLTDFDRVVPSRLAAAVDVALPRRYALDAGRLGAIGMFGILVRHRPDLVVVNQTGSFDGAYLTRAARLARRPYVLVVQQAGDLDWPTDAAAPDGAPRVRAGAELGVRVRAQPPTDRGSARRHDRPSSRDTQPGSHDWSAADAFGPGAGRARVGVRRPARAAGEGPGRPGARTSATEVARSPVDGDVLRRRAPANGHRRPRPHARRPPGARGGAGGGHRGRLAAAPRPRAALPQRRPPLALLEAMACGRPAVVTDVGGCAEVVEDGRSGFVAAAPTVAALDAALERAWAARRGWAALGARAAERVWEVADRDPGARLAAVLVA